MPDLKLVRHLFVCYCGGHKAVKLSSLRAPRPAVDISLLMMSPFLEVLTVSQPDVRRPREAFSIPWQELEGSRAAEI